MSQGVMGGRRLQSLYYSSFLLLLLPPTFLLLLEPFQGLQSFRKSLLQHGLSMGHNSFRKYPTALAWAPTWAAVWISVLLWSSPHAAGKYLLWQLKYFLYLSFSDLDVPTAVSSSFPHFSAFLMFLPFLKYAFTDMPPAWLMGSAVSCGGSIMEPTATVCVQHRADPVLFSQGLPVHPPAPKTLTPTTNICQE